MHPIDVDPAERNAALTQLEQLASYDPLTHLTNRNLLYTQLENRLKEADRFGYLERFPIDIIKIDQSFVRDAPSDQDDAPIVRAIVAMAKSGYKCDCRRSGNRSTKPVCYAGRV